MCARYFGVLVNAMKVNVWRRAHQHLTTHPIEHTQDTAHAHRSTHNCKRTQTYPKTGAEVKLMTLKKTNCRQDWALACGSSFFGGTGSRTTTDDNHTSMMTKTPATRPEPYQNNSNISPRQKNFRNQLSRLQVSHGNVFVADNAFPLHLTPHITHSHTNAHEYKRSTLSAHAQQNIHAHCTRPQTTFTITTEQEHHKQHSPRNKNATNHIHVCPLGRKRGSSKFPLGGPVCGLEAAAFQCGGHAGEATDGFGQSRDPAVQQRYRKSSAKPRSCRFLLALVNLWQS